MDKTILQDPSKDGKGCGDDVIAHAKRIESAETPPDPFSPERFRLSQDFAATVGVKKALLTVPVREPDKTWFVRVHPDESYRLQAAVLELKEDREVYLVDPSILPELSTETTIIPKALFTTINRQGVLFIWHIRMPGLDGRIDDWNRSAMEAADMAVNRWVRVVANMNLGAYDVYEATADIREPDWPDAPFSELIRVAFKGKIIDAFDHDVLRRLRGEV